ncbi:flagellar motor protein MotB [Flavobacterium sp. ALD4]|uniref:flagellar motor protein MotB n=1 Tax=Flavobacterium sp. ALD4 TaxID=2058314 RepID=UPI000C330ED2|nr:flagellar motor protein MotB [Flavobacterium sp. ALD4]PKH69288.1 flagellar motor protein MotB [Flavobacterium sp. ALD4]
MRKKLIFFTTISLVSFKIHSQNEKVYITDKINAKYAYINATQTYERVAAKGYKSVDLFQKLGNSYYSNSRLDKAAKWYGELFAITSDLDREYYSRYAKCLMFLEKNDQANKVLQRLKQKIALEELIELKK